MANKKRKGNKSTRLIISLVLFLCAAYFYSHRHEYFNTPADDVGIELAIPQFTKAVESHVIEHTGYTVSYNQKRRNPNWVAYELTAEEAEGKVSRGDDFVPDPMFSGRQATDDDYKRSGWDRGHLAPAADMKWSEKAMDESFYLTNISPQNNNLNRGVWKSIEELARDAATRYGKVLVVTGPVFTTKNGLGSIGLNKVAIPNSFFKVLLVNDNGYKGIGFYCENVAGKKHLSKYAMTIDGIEEIVGLDFFHKLPDDVEEYVENHYSLEVWGIKDKRR